MIEDIVKKYQNEKKLVSLYRLESDKSNHNLTIELPSGRINCRDTSLYTYFSFSSRHHEYFYKKRIRLYLDQLLKQKAGLVLRKPTILHQESFHQIKEIVEKDESVHFSSIHLYLAPSFLRFLEDNLIRQTQKQQQKRKLPELADQSKYHGGIGVCGAWLNLLVDMTLFTESRQLNAQDHLQFLETIKKNYVYGKSYLQENHPILEKMNYRIRINPALFSTYHKYEILEEIEYIRKNSLLLETENQSNKGKNWEKILLKEYETTRNQIFSDMEENYRHLL